MSYVRVDHDGKNLFGFSVCLFRVCLVSPQCTTIRQEVREETAMLTVVSAYLLEGARQLPPLKLS